jgi:hypothetical protein
MEAVEEGVPAIRSRLRAIPLASEMEVLEE